MEIVITNKTGLSYVDDYAKTLVDDLRWLFGEIKEITPVNVRLAGSAARGEADESLSGFDVMAIIRNPLSEAISNRLESKALLLSRKYNKYKKIHIRALSPKEITPLELLILKSDSFSLWGEDMFSTNMIKMDSDKLISISVPDFETLVFNGRHSVIGATNKEDKTSEIRYYCAQLFYYMQKILIINKSTFSFSINEIYKNLKREDFVPGEQIDSIYKVFKNPDCNKSLLFELFDDVSFNRAVFE